MQINNIEWDNLKKELDDRYVKQRDCNETQEKINKKFANDNARIEIITHEFKTIKWLITTIATASIGALVVNLFDLILK